MFVDVAFTRDEQEHIDLAEFHFIAVVDVLRATTTMVTALEKGARAVVPVATPEEALAYAARMGRPGSGDGARASILLGGERQARPIAGFDAGNSPREYTAQVVAGRTVVMTTTNGTQTFRRVLAALAPPTEVGSFAEGTGQGPEQRQVVAACLRNARAVAEAAVKSSTAGAQNRRPEERRVLIVCAGTQGRFSWDDAYTAGVLVTELARLTPLRLGDGARAAQRLVGRASSSSEELRRSRHGRRLVEMGFGEDVDFCAQVNVSPVVPYVFMGMLVKGPPASRPRDR